MDDEKTRAIIREELARQKRIEENKKRTTCPRCGHYPVQERLDGAQCNSCGWQKR